MNESDYFWGGKWSCYGFILENSSTVSRKREKENPLILSVDPNASPPLLSPQQWMSRGVWLPSILGTTGTFQESPRDPFRRGDWALCPAFPRPSGGLKGNEDHAAGGWSTWRHRAGVCVRACVYVYFFWGGIPLQTHGRGFQGLLFSSPLVTTGLVLLPVAHMFLLDIVLVDIEIEFYSSC